MTTDTSAEPDVIAAGCVVWRHAVDGQIEVCVVHRPKRHDWTIPKGKLDPGEHILACAVREIAEETGHHVALERPLPSAHYVVKGQRKSVHYWSAIADAAASERHPDHEIDEVRFVPSADAIALLDYDHDRALVSLVAEKPIRTSPLVVVRHANAVSRSSWDGTDTERPLNSKGQSQAEILVTALAALGIQHAVSSDAVRCLDTLQPWAQAHDVPIDVKPELSEQSFTDAGIRAAVAHLPATPTVLCSHRPVLPMLLEEVGAESDDALQPGEFIVVHRNAAENPGRVVAVERHTV